MYSIKKKKKKLNSIHIIDDLFWWGFGGAGKISVVDDTTYALWPRVHITIYLILVIFIINGVTLRVFIIFIRKGSIVTLGFSS